MRGKRCGDSRLFVDIWVDVDWIFVVETPNSGDIGGSVGEF